MDTNFPVTFSTEFLIPCCTLPTNMVVAFEASAGQRRNDVVSAFKIFHNLWLNYIQLVHPRRLDQQGRGH